MFNRKIILVFSFILFLFVACDEDVPQEALAPSQLDMEILVSESNTGEIEVLLRAVNANFFTISFDENSSFQQFAIEDQIKHTYSDSGTYIVTARAHALSDVFIEIQDTVFLRYGSRLRDRNIPKTGYETPLEYDGYQLAWKDEFEGNRLSSDWTYRIGTGTWGWGNNEKQYYRKENTEVGGGFLTITAKEESFNGSEYTSSRLVTEGKQFFKYGRIDIRAALPKGKGIWPALWMLGESFSTKGWPSCGEIDIMEMVGGNGGAFRNDVIHGTAHWEENNKHTYVGASNELIGQDYSEEFHVFSIIWDENAIQWYRDDIMYFSLDIIDEAKSEFKENFFFLFNVAVGGNWPGSPDDSTVFPQRMHVDYIRVFQKK